jgi:glycosyltransferase involved in cell wall biosynthesis
VRIVFIAHSPALYGANRSLLALVGGLRRYDVDAYAIAPSEGDLTRELAGHGVPTAILPLAFWVSRRPSTPGSPAQPVLRQYLRRRRGAVRRLVRNIRLLPQLVARCRSWKVEVVYTNTSITPIGAMLAWQLRCPHVWHLREFSDLDYGFHYDWGRGFSRTLIRKASAIIAVSQSIKRYYLEDSDPHGYVVYNGVASLEQFDQLYADAHALRSFGADQPCTFAVVGYVQPSKGQQEAIQALALLLDQFPHTRLLIVGAGTTKRLEELACDLKVADNVEFWGHIEDPNRAYLAADAILMCSRHEAMGRVTVEAMAACRPVIGYDQGGTSELIQHEQTGLLYRGGPEALARCMRRFIENRAWMHELGINGWHMAREKCNVETYARQVYEILRHCR